MNDAQHCLCTHIRSRQTAGKGQCWATVCGCSKYRPKETEK